MQKIKLKKVFRIVSCLSLLFFTSVQAADFPNDLVLNPGSVYFSKEIPIVSSNLRIYASVTNNSVYDLSGTVKFYDEKMQMQIGIDQPISVLAGSTDDVFVDFQIEGYGDHPISVRVLPWELNGDNPDNNKVTQNIFVDYDTDGDGVPNSLDIDDDNDGCNDNVDDLPYDSSDCLDTDGDKIGNKLDPDDDNDELLDIEEIEKGTDPLLYDTDDDGVNDKDDFYPLDKTKSADSDNDGIADEEDDDDDNDGCLDIEDAFPLNPAECLDTDGDGIGNNEDDDDDNEGLKDFEEQTITATDPLLSDTDGDGVNDKDDYFPLDPNETQDSDRDGLGDNADPNDENSGPIAVLYTTTLISKAGESVEFDGSRSIDSDGSVVDFEWGFGDVSQKENGQRVEHVFEEAGTYQVTLKVTDDKQESRIKTVEMLVKRDLMKVYILISFGLVVLFIAVLKKFIDGVED